MAARHSLHGGTKVTDYDRTTVRETTTDPVADPAVARDRVVSRSYQTGPTPGEVIRRFQQDYTLTTMREMVGALRSDADLLLAG